MYDKNFISIIYERYNISTNQFFNLFDDDGKVIVNFEDYICYANVFELLCKIDSSIINSLPKGYYNFFKYMHSFIKKSDNHFDVGYNFYTGEHDEFVKDNMTESGYKKMYKAIKEYILKYKPYFNEQNTVSDEIKL